MLLLLKVAIVALFVQPFVHIGGSRYWTTLGPLLGLATAVLLEDRRSRTRAAGAGEDLRERWLSRLQAALGAAVVLVAISVVSLASFAP